MVFAKAMRNPSTASVTFISSDSFGIALSFFFDGFVKREGTVVS